MSLSANPYAAVLESSLGASEKLVLLALVDHLPTMRPSQARIARLASLHRVTVSEVVARLVEAGVLGVEQARGRATLYRISWDKLTPGKNKQEPAEPVALDYRLDGGTCSPGLHRLQSEATQPVALGDTNKPQGINHKEKPPTGGGGEFSGEAREHFDAVAGDLADRFAAVWIGAPLGAEERARNVRDLAQRIGAHGAGRVGRAMNDLPSRLKRRFPECRRLAGALAVLDQSLAELARADELAAVRRTEAAERAKAQAAERAQQLDTMARRRAVEEVLQSLDDGERQEIETDARGRMPAFFQRSALPVPWSFVEDVLAERGFLKGAQGWEE